MITTGSADSTQKPGRAPCKYLIEAPEELALAGDPGIVAEGHIDDDGMCNGWPVMAQPVTPARAGSTALPYALGFAGVVALAIYLLRDVRLK